MDRPALIDAIATCIATDWEIEKDEVHPHDDAPYTTVAVLANPDEIAGSVLDAKVAALCPNCRGTIPDTHCIHPNAPTIAKLLAIGAAVITSGYGKRADDSPWERYDAADNLADALRAVEP